MASHRRARLSFFYLAGYLIPTGLGLLLAPDLVFKLTFSNGHYGDVMPRMAGTVALGLGIIVVQFIRHRIEVLYPTAIGVRVMFIAIFTVLYFRSGDPFFLVVNGVIAVGLVWTAIGYLLDRRDAAKITAA